MKTLFGCTELLRFLSYKPDFSNPLKEITFALFAGLMLLGASPALAQDDCAGTLTKLSACTADHGTVVVGAKGCKDVYVDQPVVGGTIKSIRIQKSAALCVRESDVNAQPAGELLIEVERIQLEGTFSIGSATAQIGSLNPRNHVTLRFLGPQRNVEARSNPQLDVQGACPDPKFSKGIDVCDNGVLRMFGVRGVPGTSPTRVSWSALSQPAGDPTLFGAMDANNQPTNIGIPVTEPDASTIHIAADVSQDWQQGDWIVIGTTSYSPFETEFAKIAAPPTIVAGGTQLKLTNPLKFYHFGSSAPDTTTSDPNCKDATDPSGTRLLPASFCQGKTQNYGIDERAEVGLISRNITLTSDAGTASDRMLWGGEIKMAPKFEESSIQGVEIEKFGKPQLGSYPVHYHMAGSVKGKTLLNANSIHHSYNKCVTVHATSDLTVKNNVCARIVGQIFYEERGYENNVTFDGNLGLGAMSNSFDIASTDALPEHQRDQLIKNYWWTGDNMTNAPGTPADLHYDGLNVPNLDDQTDPVHGSCQVKMANGGLTNPTRSPNTPPSPRPPCKPNEIYVEPANGFWITNPGTVLTNNSIGGCQGVGRGYWYVTWADPSVQFKQVTFKNNRVHSCYDGLYDENEFTMQSSQTLNPRIGDIAGGQPLIATFDGLTATRIRDRGVWMRSAWFVVKNSRFATTRDAVTLLTSGGLDGNGPGVWELLESSVVAGLSANNIDRFGPCPAQSALGPGTGWDGFNFGCIDRTPGAADEMGKGYPDYRWNFAGYMIYDGPVRIINDRFVNFKVKPELTAKDQTFLDAFNTSHPFGVPPASIGPPVPYQYEGDAVFGWFQSNQSSYPNATISELLRFDNVNLRHQIYTERANLGTFNDSDKNTAIIDRDGTLTDLVVVDNLGAKLDDVHPISLNNLEINASRLPANPVVQATQIPDESSVDECQSKGSQDALWEQRPTSLMSPGDIGALEFSALFPIQKTGERHDQLLTFMKDSTDYNLHARMVLHGRDGRGIWEPRVTNGYGYTVTAAPITTGAPCNGEKPPATCQSGIPNRIEVGVADVVKEHIAAHPFVTRIGICYTDTKGNHPQDPNAFHITRGFKGYGGSNVPSQIDKLLNVYFNKLDNEYLNQTCHDLDTDNPGNLGPKGCPADGVMSDAKSTCPAGLTKVQIPPGSENMYCVFPKSSAPLTSVNSLDGLLTNGKPDPGKYNYDPASGMLTLFLTQDFDNAVGPSPLGSCTGSNTDPDDCPNKRGENYYACPAPGCQVDVIKLNDSSYLPGPSNCGQSSTPYDPAQVYTFASGKYAQEPPANQNQLALQSNNTPVTGVPVGAPGEFPHAQASPAPACESP